MKYFSSLTSLTLAAIATTSGCVRAQNAPAPSAQMPVPSQGWQPVPLMTAAQKAAPSVQIGGEGAQWPRAMAWSNDGQLALYGTDVGGIFRSLNGGQTWEPCNVGYTPRGSADFAIDPNNSQRAISIGANSAVSNYHGPYLSEDAGASWKQTYEMEIAGYRDWREQVAFDASTYDAAAKMTRVVYWSSVAKDNPGYGKSKEDPSLFKSTDGGASWQKVSNTENIGGSHLKTRPAGGVIYAGNDSGLHVSRDGGASWKTTLQGEVTGVSVSAKTPDNVWATKADGLYISNDRGASWNKVAGSAAITKDEAPLRNVHVAPADANQMVLWRQGKNYDWPRFTSSDGGATWTEAKMDKSLAFLPTNARQGLFAFHPTDANVLLSTGGDYPTISRDGGQSYGWTGDGVNNILAGRLQFNAQNPDLLFVSSQDYNGASTLDGGVTWTYQNPSGKGWGGFTYGGYAASEKVMVVGDASGWGKPRELTVTRDGGQTWNKTGLTMSGPDLSMGDPTDAKVIFASNLRSADDAQSWAPMEANAGSSGCDGVYTFNAKTGELWGIAGKDKEAIVVASTDKGATWRAVKPLAYAKDLAIDARDGKLWAVTDKLHVLDAGAQAWREVENLPRDLRGSLRVRSVALDPMNPDIIYLASNRDVFATAQSALRSLDGGASWQTLTRQNPLDAKVSTGKDGGREAFWVRVHPKTREAWFVTGCYGLWKYGAPTQAEINVKKLASNTAPLMGTALAGAPTVAPQMARAGETVAASDNMLPPTDKISEWIWQRNAPAQATLAVETDDKGAYLIADVQKIGDKNWQVQLARKGLTLENGQRYTLSFEARADESRKILVQIGRDGGDYKNVGLYQNVELSSAWKPYSYSFEAKDAIAEKSRLSLMLGGATGKVSLRDLKLIPAG